MMLDYHSLLLALGFSAACLMLTTFGTWFSRRTDSFLLTFVIGLSLLIGGIVAYSGYSAGANHVRLLIAYSFMVAGFSTAYGAATQFQTGKSPWARMGINTVLLIAAGTPFIVTGLDGVAIIFLNLSAAALLIGSGWRYYAARKEAPGLLCGIALFYIASGISFALCAVVLTAGRQWRIGHAPVNWAETLNIVVCVAAMTGIGALSLALHQWRLSAHHRLEAMTDSLTGLLNRRALFERFGESMIEASTAVVVFDIDRFKSVNDSYGHAAGDEVLKVFAAILKSSTEDGLTFARLGGEEFVGVFEDVLAGRAERIANKIVREFAESRIVLGTDGIDCTVSAGVAAGRPGGKAFESVLRSADDALYQAKRAGRNRVQVSGYLSAVDGANARADG